MSETANLPRDLRRLADTRIFTATTFRSARDLMKSAADEIEKEREANRVLIEKLKAYGISVRRTNRT